MMISKKATWTAVHRIYESAHIEVGGSLSMKDLMKTWVDTCMRQCDLAMALDTLSQAGYLQIEMNTDGPHARLLSRGFADITDSANEAQPMAETAVATLRAFRPNTETVASLIDNHLIGRRATDRAPATYWHHASAA